MQETISNNITYSRVTGAPQAAWTAENTDATETQLTLASKTTSPKRLTTYDEVSWMRLAGADRDFGVIPIVTQELMRGCRQAREKAVYGAANTNGPTGLGGISGVLAGVIGGSDGNTDPTYADVLNMLVDIADADIPIDMLRWVLSWQSAAKLATDPDLRELELDVRGAALPRLRHRGRDGDDRELPRGVHEPGPDRISTRGPRRRTTSTRSSRACGRT